MKVMLSRPVGEKNTDFMLEDSKFRQSNNEALSVRKWALTHVDGKK